MGNCLAMSKPMESISNDVGPSKEDVKMVQIMRMDDGKMLEFRNPLLVKDLVKNYPKFYVGIFKQATQALPMEYKLKLGKIYYLLPCFDDHEEVVEQRRIEEPKKRIKVVITKQEFQQLIAKQGISLDELVSKVIEAKRSCGSTWVPMLESIPEEEGDEVVS